MISCIVTVLIHASASAATINPIIDSDYEMKADGTLVIEAYLSNDGDVPLHHATATIFFDDQAARSEDLGDCRPGMDAAYITSFNASHVSPGDYILMVQFNFNEPDGRMHRAFQTRQIRIPGSDGADMKTLLEGNAQGPAFNPKAFWKNEDRIQLMLKNGHKEPITPHIVFYLPNAFFSPHGTLRPTLPPGKSATIEVPLVYTGEFQNGGAFIAVAQYTLAGRHYATAIRGDVTVVSKPVFFRGYVIASVLILIAVGVFLVRKSKIKGEKLSHPQIAPTRLK